MKGKIKILSLLMAMAMVSSMFVACKGGDDTSTPAADDVTSAALAESKTESKPDAPAADAPATATKDPVKLKWYHFGDAPKKNGDKVIAALNEKSMKDINTEIDFQWTTGDDQKLKTLMSTGGEFDIAFTCAWFANYVISAQGGQLADITEKVKTVTPKLYEYIPEVVWEGSKVNGKIYAVPVYKDTAAAQYWTVNKEYVIDKVGAEKEFKATGMELSTVTPLLEKVKAYADKNGYENDLTAPMCFDWNGLNGFATGWDNIGLDNLRLGIKIDSGDTKLVSHLEDPGLIADWKIVKSWHDTGLTNKDALTKEKAFDYITVGTSQCWDGSEAVLANGKPYSIVINKRYGPVYTTAAIQGSMNGISPNSKNIDRALEYIEYSNTNKEYRNMLGYGIQGVNWELTPAGNAKALNSEWAPGMFSQASFFELYPLEPAPADMYVNLKATNDTAKPSPLVGMVPDVAPIANEVAACSTIFEKYARSLATGDCKDVDATCAKALKELNGAGYEKIKTELQKQVDAFMATK